MKKIIFYLIPAFLLMALISCKKELPVYELNNETVKLNSIDKNTLKRQSEFISQAYADLFGKPISNNNLEETLICYKAFSDKELVQDMIIRDMLKEAQGKIPDREDMELNIDSFTVATYKKFFHRRPNELELWSLRNMIQTDTTFGPGVIYYAFMTSEEYKFY